MLVCKWFVARDSGFIESQLLMINMFNLSDRYFRTDDINGGFITLVAVERTGSKHEDAPAERIWSDLFYWIDYELGHDRCMFWYKRQPDPKMYIGKYVLQNYLYYSQNKE